jgi:hypothetical protein
MLTMLAMLVIGHALCDFPLQSAWMAQAKSHRHQPIAGEIIWPGVLGAHCALHAGAVWLITGSAALAAAEFVAHFVIDYTKCDGRLSFNQDLALHIGCKALWVAVAAVAFA